MCGARDLGCLSATLRPRRSPLTAHFPGGYGFTALCSRDLRREGATWPPPPCAAHRACKVASARPREHTDTDTAERQCTASQVGRRVASRRTARTEIRRTTSGRRHPPVPQTRPRRPPRGPPLRRRAPTRRCAGSALVRADGASPRAASKTTWALSAARTRAAPAGGSRRDSP